MRITTARRISQAFFFMLFLWFCVAATVGEAWWQLRGWPVNWFLQLSPLTALGTALTTGALYAGLAWALATVALTLVLGRFFCSWLCPFGTLHHAVGFLGGRKLRPLEKARRNRYHRAQSLKYYILFFLLGAAAADLMVRWMTAAPAPSSGLWIAGLLVLLALCLRGLKEVMSWTGAGIARFFVFIAVWVLLGWGFAGHSLVGASLQSGLVDPISLIYRSVNLAVLPLAGGAALGPAGAQRFTAGVWLIGLVFIGAVLANLFIPRFYCRFVCPLGALFGVLSRNALWRIGKNEAECVDCLACETHCEGACSPAGKIRIDECVLCMNCLHTCRDGLISYRTSRSAGGEILSPDLARRGFSLAFFSGLVAVPLLRLDGMAHTRWSAKVVRPPGALGEGDFLRRCIKCGQCMRVCPTNVIHPAMFQGGLEGLWAPILDFRAGTSGCQYNCVACGQVCPTAAIRPLTIEEKHGKGAFSGAGPIRLGTAFVDRGRCLPWAMDRPCIVCQENCPVSPKAIFTRLYFSPVRDGRHRVAAVEGALVHLAGTPLEPGALSTGDYFCRFGDGGRSLRRSIADNTAGSLVLAPAGASGQMAKPGAVVQIEIRLKQPYVDLRYCIGCGICEHECPVEGRRAIRVWAENESRDKTRRLTIG